MPNYRTKWLGTKVTEDEYAQCQALAGTQRLTEWARAVLLRATESDALQQALLAEVLALRTILLNVHFAAANGQPVTMDRMQMLIDRADHDKWDKVRERVAAAVARGQA
jgi:hypothetical protein